jgi:hypothetical protein
MTEQPRNSMLIEWSDEDQAYLVTLPEWADRVFMPVTHGDMYDQEVMRMLVKSAREQGEAVPAPRLWSDKMATDAAGVSASG